MTMQYPPPAAPDPFESTFEPSAEQIERARALRNFNRKFVYLPLGIAIFIVVTIVVSLLVAVFVYNTPEARSFVSGLADMVIIVFSIPVIAVGAVLLGGVVALALKRREQRKEHPRTGPLARYSRSQIFLWRLENYVERLGRKTEEVAPKVTGPVTNFQAQLAYMGAWVNSVVDGFVNGQEPSKSDDGDDTDDGNDGMDGRGTG